MTSTTPSKSRDTLWMITSLALLALVIVLLVTAYESGLQTGFEAGRADAGVTGRRPGPDSNNRSPFYRSTIRN